MHFLNAFDTPGEWVDPDYVIPEMVPVVVSSEAEGFSTLSADQVALTGREIGEHRRAQLEEFGGWAALMSRMSVVARLLGGEAFFDTYKSYNTKAERHRLMFRYPEEV